MRAWVEARNLALANWQRLSDVKELSASDCATCDDLIEPIEEVYEAGGDSETDGLASRDVKTATGRDERQGIGGTEFAGGQNSSRSGSEPVDYPPEKRIAIFELSSIDERWAVSLVRFVLMRRSRPAAVDSVACALALLRSRLAAAAADCKWEQVSYFQDGDSVIETDMRCSGCRTISGRLRIVVDPVGRCRLCSGSPSNCGESPVEYLLGTRRSDDVDPWMAAAALRRTPLPPARLIVQPPNGRTLVNFATNFYTERQEFTRTVRLLGQRVQLRISPAQFTWHFDDGESTTTTSRRARPTRSSRSPTATSRGRGEPAGGHDVHRGVPGRRRRGGSRCPAR